MRADKVSFETEPIVSAEGEVWGGEVLFRHPAIPNSVLFAAPNPELDLFLLRAFIAETNGALQERRTFNVSFLTLLYFPREIHNLLAEHPNLFLEITETHASRQERDLRPVLELLAAWSGRFFLDDFLKGGHGLEFFNAARPYLAGVKVDLRDLNLITLSPDLRQDLMVVVERVETPSDFELAARKGATHFQGRLFKSDLPKRDESTRRSESCRDRTFSGNA